MSYFITNISTRSFFERLLQLITISKELNILSGFFYFFGLCKLYKILKDNSKVLLKILLDFDVNKLKKMLIKYTINETC